MFLAECHLNGCKTAKNKVLKEFKNEFNKYGYDLLQESRSNSNILLVASSETVTLLDFDLEQDCQFFINLKEMTVRLSSEDSTISFKTKSFIDALEENGFSEGE